jgi:soluble lytic murein transglycosylase-like protein
LAAVHDVGVSLVRAVVAVESAGRPIAVSPKGARGLMQLMPSTAIALGLRTRQDLHDPRRNLDAGIRHLKQLLASHQGNVALALAAYNAGSGAVARHGHRIPPYRETMLYVPAVLARAAQP